MFKIITAALFICMWFIGDARAQLPPHICTNTNNFCWNTATRPIQPATGDFGYNLDSNIYEWWNGTNWTNASNLPVLNPTIVCDGTTDNAPAIQAAINAFQATTPTGGIVQLPNCNQIGIGAPGLTINSSNIYIQGTGGSTGIIDATPVSHYTGKPWATTVLTALPSLSGGTMITYDPAAGGPAIKRGGVSQLVLACSNIAANGIVTFSQRGGVWEWLVIENCTGVHLDIGTTADAKVLLNNDIKDNQFGWFHNILIQFVGATVPSATGIRLRGGNSPAGSDVALAAFKNIRINGGANSIGLDCVRADSNTFENLAFSSATPTTDILLRAHATEPTCRSNHFINVALSGNPPLGSTLVVQGREIGTNLPLANYMWINTYAPGGFLQAQLPGLANEGNAAVTWSTNFGESNIGPPSQENLIINGSFMLNQRFGAGAFNPTTTAFVTDRWKAVVQGAFSGVTTMGFIQNTAQHPATATTSGRISTVTQRTPAAADAVSLCQNIEGVDVADLGWGTGSAQPITLSFWYFAPTGTYSMYLTNSARDRSYVISFNVVNFTSWYYFTFQIPGDTTGTWLTGVGQVGISLCKDLGASVPGSGTDFQTNTVNAWQAGEFHEHTGDYQQIAQPGAGATITYITQVRLKKGLGSTLYAQPGRQQELARAQRYYSKTFPVTTAPANNAGLPGALCVLSPVAASQLSAVWKFPVEMAKIPTIATYNPSAGNVNWRNVTLGTDIVATVDLSTALGTGQVQITSANVAAIANNLCIHVTADADF